MPIHQPQITALLPMVTDIFLIFNNPNLKKLSQHEKQMLKCDTQGRCIACLFILYCLVTWTWLQGLKHYYMHDTNRYLPLN